MMMKASLSSRLSIISLALTMPPAPVVPAVPVVPALPLVAPPPVVPALPVSAVPADPLVTVPAVPVVPALPDPLPVPVVPAVADPVPACPLPFPVPVVPAAPVPLALSCWHPSAHDNAKPTASKPMSSLFDIVHLKLGGTRTYPDPNGRPAISRERGRARSGHISSTARSNRKNERCVH